MFLLYQRASLFTNRKFSYSSEVITRVRVFLSKRQFTLFNKGRRNITAKKTSFLYPAAMFLLIYKVFL